MQAVVDTVKTGNMANSISVAREGGWAECAMETARYGIVGRTGG